MQGILPQLHDMTYIQSRVSASLLGHVSHSTPIRLLHSPIFPAVSALHNDVMGENEIHHLMTATPR